MNRGAPPPVVNHGGSKGDIFFLQCSSGRYIIYWNIRFLHYFFHQLKSCFPRGLSNIGELLINGLLNRTQRHTLVLVLRRLYVNWPFLYYLADKVRDEKDNSDDSSHHPQNDEYRHWRGKIVSQHSCMRCQVGEVFGCNRHFRKGRVMGCGMNSCMWFWHCCWTQVMYSWSHLWSGYKFFYKGMGSSVVSKPLHHLYLESFINKGGFHWMGSESLLKTQELPMKYRIMEVCPYLYLCLRHFWEG